MFYVAWCHKQQCGVRRRHQQGRKYSASLWWMERAREVVAPKTGARKWRQSWWWYFPRSILPHHRTTRHKFLLIWGLWVGAHCMWVSVNADVLLIQGQETCKIHMVIWYSTVYKLESKEVGTLIKNHWHSKPICDYCQHPDQMILYAIMCFAKWWTSAHPVTPDTLTWHQWTC